MLGQADGTPHHTEQAGVPTQGGPHPGRTVPDDTIRDIGRWLRGEETAGRAFVQLLRRANLFLARGGVPLDSACFLTLHLHSKPLYQYLLPISGSDV